MKVIELIYAPYELSLKKPFTTSKGEISKRKGFILNLKNSQGVTGVGDAAPLPSFGSETYEEAENYLKQLKIKISLDLNDLEKSLEINLNNFESYPALRHGFEQALLNLITKEKNISLSSLLNCSLKKEIKVNAAIGFLSPEESAEKTIEYLNRGFKTIKIKVGRNNFEEDINVIKAVRKTAGNKVKIRIDANGAWDINSAISRLKELKNFNLEYIEQPVNDLSDFMELSSKSAIPLAADESIRKKNDAELFINNKAVSVIIIKPMMIGGLLPSLEIIRSAELKNIKTIITSSFESAIGRNSAIFAAAFVKGNYAHGLAASDFILKDLISDPFPVSEGKIILQKIL